MEWYFNYIKLITILIIAANKQQLTHALTFYDNELENLLYWHKFSKSSRLQNKSSNEN